MSTADPAAWGFLLLAASAGAATPTPTPTVGVASERGLASFVVLLVLIAGTLWYLRRRRAG